MCQKLSECTGIFASKIKRIQIIITFIVSKY